jgi:hypothetical protein
MTAFPYDKIKYWIKISECARDSNAQDLPTIMQKLKNENVVWYVFNAPMHSP